jgi:hypothetical protein
VPARTGYRCFSMRCPTTLDRPEPNSRLVRAERHHEPLPRTHILGDKCSLSAPLVFRVYRAAGCSTGGIDYAGEVVMAQWPKLGRGAPFQLT